MSNKIILEEKYLGEIYHDKSELPKKVRIDASTKCQLDCERCYMRMDKEGVENGCRLGNLKFDDFKKFIDENDFESIELSNHGEVFLNPELDKIIEYATTKGIALSMDNGVNLNYLSDKMAEILVKCGVKRVYVSIDGASQEDGSAVQTATEKRGVSCKKMQKNSLSWRAYDYLCIRLAAARQFK